MIFSSHFDLVFHDSSVPRILSGRGELVAGDGETVGSASEWVSLTISSVSVAAKQLHLSGVLFLL